MVAAIVIGVGGDNSNNSFGTFFEGAVVSGGAILSPTIKAQLNESFESSFAQAIESRAESTAAWAPLPASRSVML